MILVGSQRGGAGQLATHLLNDRDNEHVEVQELRGFVSNDLQGAFAEAHAISKATRCKQFLFSLSMNPPKEAEVSLEDMVKAADQAEAKLGLDGQPRAVVVHEKEGRRHIHVVWSRIDAESMKAVNLPFFKERLCGLSKELYLQHGWELPEGHRENGWKNPLNFTLAEWQQAKRLDLDPREVKQIFQGAWQQSDSMPAFKAALEEHGYYLAKGDRRGFVATDVHHEVYSISRWTGVKAKEVKERLGDPERLPGVGEVQKSLDARLTGKIRERLAESRAEQAQERAEQVLALREMVQAHRQERARLEHKLDERSKAEAIERAARLHTGIRGVWELLTGKARAIRRQNEREAFDGFVRDRTLREELFATQAKEKKKLRKGVDSLRTRHREERMRLSSHISDILHLNQEQDRTHEHMRERFQAMSFGMG